MNLSKKVKALQEKLQEKSTEPLPPNLAHALILGSGIMQSPCNPLVYYVVLQPFRRSNVTSGSGVIFVKGDVRKNPDKRFYDASKVIEITHQLQFSKRHQAIPCIPGIYLPLPMLHGGGTIPLGRRIATDVRQDGRFIEWFGWEPPTYQNGQYFFFLDTESTLRVFVLIDAKKDIWAQIRTVYANPMSLKDVRQELLAKHGDQVLNYDQYTGETPMANFS